MKKERKKLSDRRWMLEFSKRMLIMLSVCYGAMLIYAGVMLFLGKDTVTLSTFIQQVTMVFSLGVVSYLIKSAVENVFKIRNCNDDCEMKNMSDMADEHEQLLDDEDAKG